jgi:thymidylate synthase
MYLMKPYDDALQEILDEGVSRTNKRTGIKTLSVFGMCKKYRLDKGCFPLLTRRKVWPKSVFAELLWLLSGSTNNKDLQKLGCNFWNLWVDRDFEKKYGFAEDSFGPVYGFQLRHFGGYYGNGVGGPAFTDKTHVADYSCGPKINLNLYGKNGFDQLKWVVERIKEDSSCRRTLWTLWNPKDVSIMRLPPCHMLSQILVDDERRLSLILYQRSCDGPVGEPYNIVAYSALATMIAQQTNCTPYEFIHMTADSHIYSDQVDAVKEYLSTPIIDSPKLEIKKAKDIFSYTLDDFILTDYNPGPVIKIPVAV